MDDVIFRIQRGATMTAPDAAPPVDDYAHLRKPPHSQEAEQSVLGGLLLDSSAFGAIADTLAEQDFYAHTHRVIYAAITQMIADGKPVDVITVYERLQGLGTADDIGGMPYLNALAASVISASNIRRYAEIIVERATLRSIIATADEAASRAFRNDPSAQVLDDAKVALSRLADGRRIGSQRVPLLGLNDLREQAKSAPWLIKHVIPAESIGMLYGGSGTFKSFIALDAALHIAHGLPWMGRRTKQGPVLYIAAEGGSGLWARIVAWHRARRLRWENVPLHVVPVAVNLTQDAWRVVEAAQAKGISPSLVVVDTLSQTYAGEENSANEMAAYLRELGTRFRHLWACAVMLLHHTGHQATERPRGSSAIRANLDFMLGCFRDEKEMLATLTCAKQKDGDCFSDAMFSLSVHELGTDEDGDMVTSLVARHLSSAEDVQLAMESEGRAGRGGNNHLLLQLVQNGMRESELRTVFYGECGLDTPEARRQAFHRARTWAVKSGLIEVSKGVVITLKTGGAA